MSDTLEGKGLVMINVRKSADRGLASFGWLNSRHSFSFGGYYDPEHMGWGPLRVINQDMVTPGAGFDTHGHANMEIISYVLDGALEHKDSLGTGSVIRPGEVQRMSAGSGIRHSEYNASRTEPVHFLQIWIVPEAEGIEPGYEQRAFADIAPGNGLRLVASREGREGSVRLHQDADLHVAKLKAGETVSHTLAAGRLAWLQVADGAVELNGERLSAGDGAAIRDERELNIAASSSAHILLFDMAA